MSSGSKVPSANPTAKVNDSWGASPACRATTVAPEEDVSTSMASHGVSAPNGPA